MHNIKVLKVEGFVSAITHQAIIIKFKKKDLDVTISLL